MYIKIYKRGFKSNPLDTTILITYFSLSVKCLDRQDGKQMHTVCQMLKQSLEKHLLFVLKYTLIHYKILSYKTCAIHLLVYNISDNR